MKKMRKLLLIGCVLTLIFSLTACGNQKEDKGPGFSYDVEELVSNVVDNAETIFELNDEDLALYYSNYIEQAESDSSYKVLADGIEQVRSLKKEVGKYVGFYLKKDNSPKYKKTVDDDSVTISVTARFEKNGKNTDVLVKYTYVKENGQLIKSAISYEPQYSLAHRMKQAGMNTLMGMGIVIIVLAFLSVLISLFVHVQKIEKAVADANQKRAEKKRKRAERKSASYDDADEDDEDSDNQNDVSEEEEQPEEMDDTELVAVITAAIAASSQNMSRDGFVVRSIKRVPGSRWNRN